MSYALYTTHLLFWIFIDYKKVDFNIFLSKSNSTLTRSQLTFYEIFFCRKIIVDFWPLPKIVIFKKISRFF